MLFASYLVVGVFSGLLAGLFGLGGGLIIVPVLLFVFTWQGFAPDIVVHLALGTSFAIITVTSISSLWAHYRLGNMQWWVVCNMVPGLVAGVLVGAFFAAAVSGFYLQLAIAVFLITVALQMLASRRNTKEKAVAEGEDSLPGVARVLDSKKHLPAAFLQTAAGFIIGLASAFFGIGGGSMTVPYLNFYQVKMRNAVAISAACGLPIALFGALGYFLTGRYGAALPEYSTGYIYWPAVAGIALMSVPFARVGARLANKFSGQKMQYLFALFLILMAIYLLLSV